MKKALITGITGQDGSYLAELLLSKGYEVHGIVRRSSTSNTARIDHVIGGRYGSRLFLHYGDLSDSEQVSNLVYNIKADEVYNLGAQSHVRVSFDLAEYSSNVTALGAARLLDAIRRSGSKTKFYQASSSEMFGASLSPQNEETPFKPRSPYACAKVYAYWMARNYREGYDMLVWNGILFNHESPRRGNSFVTRKISRGIVDILAGREKHLSLGNLDAKRDWGYAPEYVECMWRMLQGKGASDFVIGTGESHAVKDFLEEAFGYAGLSVGKYIKTDPSCFRPTDPMELVADASRARDKLGWKPKIKFEDLARILVDADMRAAGLEPIGEGDRIIQERFPNRWWGVD
ncbi:MAG: GDP-mannose 4,6-dehydratase [Chloroflexi bacterium]|nr:GDP-mannose 4,6-dehydratase [Chloroflexota bacterium]